MGSGAPILDPATGAAVASVLRRVPGWSAHAQVLGLLGGGITNRNVLVEQDGERYVVRLPGNDSELLEIRRGDEVEAARRAAAAGFGAEVVAFVEPERSLVTRFVVGETLTAPELRTADMIERVATMLRVVHAGPPLGGSFDAFAVPGLHLAAAVSRGVPVPAMYDDCAAVARRIEAAFAASPDATVPCHNDLLAANFLRRPDGGVVLLDWEYAGDNDRFFDLGNLAVNNDFGPDDEEALIESYAGEVSRRRLARLRLMRVMSDFREAMWAVVQQGISQLDFDYRTYAAAHFERLLAATSSRDLERRLDDAASGRPEGVEGI